MYLTGWRIGGVKNLQWLRDLKDGVVTLQGEFSKNGEPVTVPLRGEVLRIIEDARAQRVPECPFIFHRKGRQLYNFRSAWRTACREAGLEERLVHVPATKRSAHMVRQGIPQETAMSISGHKTVSMFRRYNIVDPSDREDAIDRLSAAAQGVEATPAKAVPLKRAQSSGACPKPSKEGLRRGFFPSSTVCVRAYACSLERAIIQQDENEFIRGKLPSNELDFFIFKGNRDGGGIG